jgi:hypothetical protein
MTQIDETYSNSTDIQMKVFNEGKSRLGHECLCAVYITSFTDAQLGLLV